MSIEQNSDMKKEERAKMPEQSRDTKRQITSLKTMDEILDGVYLNSNEMVDLQSVCSVPLTGSQVFHHKFLADFANKHLVWQIRNGELQIEIELPEDTEGASRSLEHESAIITEYDFQVLRKDNGFIIKKQIVKSAAEIRAENFSIAVNDFKCDFEDVEAMRELHAKADWHLRDILQSKDMIGLAALKQKLTEVLTVNLKVSDLQEVAEYFRDGSEEQIEILKLINFINGLDDYLNFLTDVREMLQEPLSEEPVPLVEDSTLQVEQNTEAEVLPDVTLESVTEMPEGRKRFLSRVRGALRRVFGKAERDVSYEEAAYLKHIYKYVFRVK